MLSDFIENSKKLTQFQTVCCQEVEVILCLSGLINAT